MSAESEETGDEQTIVQTNNKRDFCPAAEHFVENAPTLVRRNPKWRLKCALLEVPNLLSF